MKTIILSESQVKNVIGRILTEQTVVRNEVRKPASLPPINIPYKFPAGYWLPTKDLISQVTNSLDPIIEFIRQHQSQKIEVSIQAGESQVTNVDNEPSSKNKGKTVPQKYLANNRANSVKTIIDNYFDNLIKNNDLSPIKEELSEALKQWMLSQNDFLLTEKMPLIKPTLHPLDRVSKWNKVSKDLVGKLSESDYIPVHY